MSNYIVESYVELRKKMDNEKDEEKKNHYVSARTLLGVLRLAQALARLRYSDSVERGDVDEALRLIRVSKESLLDEDSKEHDGDRSNISKIFRVIRDIANDIRKEGRKSKSKKVKRIGKGPRDMDVDSDDNDGASEEISLAEIRQRVLLRGFNEADFMETIIKASNPLKSVCRVTNVTFDFIVRRSGHLVPHCEQYEALLQLLTNRTHSFLYAYYYLHLSLAFCSLVFICSSRCSLSRINIP